MLRGPRLPVRPSSDYLPSASNLTYMIRVGLLCFPQRTAFSSSCRPLLRISQRPFSTSPRRAFLRSSQWFQQEVAPTGSITPDYTFMKRVGKPKILRQIIVSPLYVIFLHVYFLNLFPVRHHCFYVCFCNSGNGNACRDRVLERKNDIPFACLGSQNHYKYGPEARSECRVDSGVFVMSNSVRMRDDFHSLESRAYEIP